MGRAVPGLVRNPGSPMQGFHFYAAVGFSGPAILVLRVIDCGGSRGIHAPEESGGSIGLQARRFWQEGEGPGLKPYHLRARIQGHKCPCSLRRNKQRQSRSAFVALAEKTGIHVKALQPMFGPKGNPTAANLFNILACLQEHEGEGCGWWRELPCYPRSQMRGLPHPAFALTLICRPPIDSERNVSILGFAVPGLRLKFSPFCCAPDGILQRSVEPW